MVLKTNRQFILMEILVLTYHKSLISIRMFYITCVFFAGVAGASHFAFFPFYTSNEMNRFATSHITLNVTVKNETEWTLKNGLAADMITTNTSSFKRLIVYPAYGYYLSSNSFKRLDVKIKTHVQTNLSEYSSYYKVQPRALLGQNYTVSVATGNSSEYICAILAPIDRPLHIVITLPPYLLDKVLLDGRTLKDTYTNYTVSKGHAVKVNSSVPIQGINILSENMTFAVFCAETGIRYQLLPNRYCGKEFNAACPIDPDYSYCNVSLTSQRNSNVLFRSNSTGQRSQMFYKGYFQSFRLEPGMDMSFSALSEVCVLLSKFHFMNGSILMSHVSMMFSNDNPPTKSTPLITSRKIEPTKPTTVMSKTRQPPFSAGASQSQISSLLYSTVLPNRNTTIFHDNKTTGSVILSQITRKKFKFITISDSSKVKSTSLSQTTSFGQLFLKFSLSTHQSTKLSSSDLLTTMMVPGMSKPTSSKSFLQAKGSRNAMTPYVTDLISTMLMPAKTIPDKVECFCSPTEYCADFRQEVVSQAEVMSKLDHLRSTLSVNKSLLTSSVRQKTCAQDKRPSARNLGYVGVIVILLCSMSIIACDLITLFQLISKV